MLHVSTCFAQLRFYKNSIVMGGKCVEFEFAVLFLGLELPTTNGMGKAFGW